jgi:hypothetical protein
MAQLTLEIPDTIVARLAVLAAQDAKRIEQVAAEQLVAANTGSTQVAQERVQALFRLLESQPRLSDEDFRAFEEGWSRQSPASGSEPILEGLKG